jgi:hypothetical protein
MYAVFLSTRDKTNFLKISNRFRCETFLHNRLSNPNNVHSNRSGTASGTIYPEPCSDLRTGFIIPLQHTMN